MKVSLRILLINFVVVVLILVSSAIAFYSIFYNVLVSQQTKSIVNSSNIFKFVYKNFQDDIDSEFKLLFNSYLNKNIPVSIEELNNIDFIFSAPNDSVFAQTIVARKNVSIANLSFSIKEIISSNPLIIVKSYRAENNNYYYGSIINDDMLTGFADIISADVGIVWNKNILAVSNKNVNAQFFYLLNNSSVKLEQDKSLGVYTTGSESDDISTTIVNPFTFEKTNDIHFLVFGRFAETADLQSAVKYIIIIIGVSGTILSLILTFLFSDKLRRRIYELNEATEKLKEGKFEKITHNSNDELGKLADAFNSMLDELQKNQKITSDYADFIALINRNPTYKQVADAALRKIITASGLTAGVLYSINKHEIKLESSFGFNVDSIHYDYEFLKSLIESGESKEIDFNENQPEINTGMLTVKIAYQLFIPVQYGGEVIAIIEVVSRQKPKDEALSYIFKIQEQLAIGLSNANALMQLENLVLELKTLNEDYQKQNIQIRRQNETLIDLHKELKENATELNVQKQKAEESTHLKSNFLASMSHELRTPMNSVLGLTELILNDDDINRKVRERLEVVLRSGKRLMMLINDILDLSKIESGKMEMRYENFYINEIIEEAYLFITPLLKDKNIEFDILKYTDTNICILSDKGKVIQILFNLLGNAVKFTEQGNITFSIKSINEEKLVFEIADTGIGIGENEVNNIFEEFRQIDGTTTRKFGGTGLGLAISKKLVEMLQGEITVNSSIGSGSVFSVIIPLNKVDIKEIPAQSGSNVLFSNNSNSVNTVVLIDDDPAVRYTLGQYLISKGFDVVFSDNADEGYEIITKIKPFSVVLDILLPDNQGWKLFLKLKKNKDTNSIPVNLISIIIDRNSGFGLNVYEYFWDEEALDLIPASIKSLERVYGRKITKVIYAGENETTYNKISGLLNSAGIITDYVKNNLLEAVTKLQPDLFITDLVSNNEGGISLVNQIKNNTLTKHIPVLFCNLNLAAEENFKYLSASVREITVKNKNHHLDVLKIIRDRIKIQEDLNNLAELDNAGSDLKEKKHPLDENYLVMIVDDDPETLFTINEIVKTTGCKTVLAKNGMECIAMLSVKSPNMILLDIMMPEMDGFQTLSKIKSNSKTSSIPVFAVTARAMLEDKDIILRHGFDDYISKPVNPSTITKKIKELMGKVNAD